MPSLPHDYILGEDIFTRMGASLDPGTGKLKFEPRLNNIGEKIKVEDGGDPNNRNTGSGNKDALKDGPVDGNPEAKAKFVPDDSWEALTISKKPGGKEITAMVNDAQAMGWTYNPMARKTVITPDAVKALMDAGAITKKDFLDGEKMKLPNGLKLRSNKFKVAKLKVGNYVVTNLTIEVSRKAENNVLGKAFFRKFLPEIHEQDGKLYIKPKRRPRTK